MRNTPGLRAAALAAVFIWRSHPAPAQLTALGSQYWDQDSPGVLDTADAGDAFGEAMTSGDFNCDGYADLVIGIPHEDVVSGNSVHASAGAVHIFYGGAAGISALDEILTEANTVDGPDADDPETNDHFGWAVEAYVSEGCGKRLAVGAPHEDFSGHTNAGKVFLFRYSSAAGHFVSVDTLTQSDINILEDNDDDEFGYSLAAVDFPDLATCVDGSHNSGLAVGAPGEAIHLGANNEGAVYIFRSNHCVAGPGGAWELDDMCNVFGDVVDTDCAILDQGEFETAESGDRFGETLSGRQFGRLIIGVPGEDNDAGLVHVIYDAATLGANTWRQSDLTHGASEANDGFGSAIAEGDFDGDGAFDLAVGIPGEDVNNNTIAAGGAVAVLYASATGDFSGLPKGDEYFDQDSFPDTGPEANDHLGDSLAAGDFNGDGLDDLAIGVPNENVGSTVDGGAFHVLYSAGAGGLDAAGSQTLTQNSSGIPGSAEECDLLGARLAAGDFDGANGSDLAVGVPGENGVCDTTTIPGIPIPSDNEGAINVLYSSLGGFLSQISASFSPSPVGEGAGTATLTLTKTGSSVVSAAVSYLAESNTATDNSDFQHFTGLVTWAVGDSSSQQFDLTVIDDPNDEPTESLNLRVLLPSDGARVVDDTIPLSILDNDVFAAFADDFDTSATAAWTSSQSTGNLFTRSFAARYAGVSGLLLTVVNTSPLFLTDERPFSSTYHARFYLRLVPLAMGNAESFVVFSATDPSGADVFKLHVARLGSARALRAFAYTDAAAAVAGGLVEFPPGRHAVEIFWQRGVAGSMTLKIDGQTVDAIAGVSNNTLRVDRVRLGGVEGFDNDTIGNFALDEFASSSSSNLNQISAFGDVDKNTDPLWNFIHSMYNFEVSNGCQAGIALPLAFCPRDGVTREELALYLVRAEDGPGAPPPADCAAAPFDDVAPGSFCRYVKALDDRGITAGCGGNNFCPRNPIRRGELGVLLLRALDGGTVTPAPCATKPFTDVETSDPRCPFIQEIKARGISNGCGGANYCPDQPVRRQELAILLQRAFGYRLPVFP